MKTDSDLITRLEAEKHWLAERVTALQFQRNPELEDRYGEQGKKHCREDAVYHIEYLMEALRMHSPKIFHHYLEWAQRMLSARDIPLSDLSEDLATYSRQCRNGCPPN
ncbi:MAG: hypothetical protein U5K69_00180 [Balneolaceae bacterium]|nr:hypothetical protein [Balneolaceae bacterium]